jgi:hypothetical protein
MEYRQYPNPQRWRFGVGRAFDNCTVFEKGDPISLAELRLEKIAVTRIGMTPIPNPWPSKPVCSRRAVAPRHGLCHCRPDILCPNLV